MILGIDLGTTYSVGAYIDDNNTPHVIQNSEGDTCTPSVVLLDSADNIVVGEIAKDNIVIRPEDVISVVKNEMGKRVVIKEKNNTPYTPEMISSFILRKIVKDAEQSSGICVDGVVITVPAYFKDSQRKATEDAAAIAGLSLVGMINEPTAAALCYVSQSHIQDKKLLIYDLGGGTFDVTILNVRSEKEMDVLATDGLSNAGGRFFDKEIVDYVREILEEKHQIDLEDDEYVDDLQELYIKAEKAKMQLSSKSNANILMRIGSIRETIEISRQQFQEMIAKTCDKTIRKMSSTMEAAGLQKEDIDEVLLVGGSSRIPYIRQKVAEFIGKDPSVSINPDEAVAIGAALYACTNISGQDDIAFTDVCSHSIGVVVVNRDGTEENEKIILRNTKLPTEKIQSFRTISENQRRISISITEGEYKELTDVTIIGNFDIDLPQGVPKNSLIRLTISLDKHQLIHMRIALPDAGFEKEYHMRRIANMDEEEIQNVTGMLRDTAVN